MYKMAVKTNNELLGDIGKRMGSIDAGIQSIDEKIDNVKKVEVEKVVEKEVPVLIAEDDLGVLYKMAQRQRDYVYPLKVKRYDGEFVNVKRTVWYSKSKDDVVMFSGGIGTMPLTSYDKVTYEVDLPYLDVTYSEFLVIKKYNTVEYKHFKDLIAIRNIYDVEKRSEEEKEYRLMMQKERELRGQTYRRYWCGC